MNLKFILREFEKEFTLSSLDENFEENVNFPKVVNFFSANWENICYREPFSVEFIQFLVPPT